MNERSLPNTHTVIIILALLQHKGELHTKQARHSWVEVAFLPHLEANPLREGGGHLVLRNER